MRGGPISVAGRRVDREHHGAAAEVVAPARDAHSGLVEQGGIERLRGLDVGGGDDHPVELDIAHDRGGYHG